MIAADRIRRMERRAWLKRDSWLIGAVLLCFAFWAAVAFATCPPSDDPFPYRGTAHARSR